MFDVCQCWFNDSLTLFGQLIFASVLKIFMFLLKSMLFLSQNFNYFIIFFSGPSSDQILSSYTFDRFLPHDLWSPKRTFGNISSLLLDKSYPCTVAA